VVGGWWLVVGCRMCETFRIGENADKKNVWRKRGDGVLRFLEKIDHLNSAVRKVRIVHRTLQTKLVRLNQWVYRDIPIFISATKECSWVWQNYDGSDDPANPKPNKFLVKFKSDQGLIPFHYSL
jgi:hypothetical protein